MGWRQIPGKTLLGPCRLLFEVSQTNLGQQWPWAPRETIEILYTVLHWWFSRVSSVATTGRPGKSWELQGGSSVQQRRKEYFKANVTGDFKSRLELTLCHGIFLLIFTLYNGVVLSVKKMFIKLYGYFHILEQFFNNLAVESKIHSFAF